MGSPDLTSLVLFMPHDCGRDAFFRGGGLLLQQMFRGKNGATWPGILYAIVICCTRCTVVEAHGNVLSLGGVICDGPCFGSGRDRSGRDRSGRVL